MSLTVVLNIKGITAYQSNRLFQEYSFKVAGYSAVTPKSIFKKVLKSL